jgi:hypothetical protein
MDEPKPPLRIGDNLVGYCAGVFGRDAYGCKRVEAIGCDWVIAREPDGQIRMYEGPPEYLCQFVVKG